MTQRSAVALYARISQDRSGQELGVRRQLEDCRAEARRRGWTVAEEYVDDDISAWSGAHRPAYERMLTDITEGRRDAVMAWRMDRLNRNMKESERFWDVCLDANVTQIVTLGGEVDLSNGSMRMVARMLQAGSAYESEIKSERIARAALQSAQAGKPWMGGPRPFGFDVDRVSHHPTEAGIVRELARRALAGETLISLATWLQTEGVPTTSGGTWRTNSVRQILTAPRMWGMRVYRDEVVGPGEWEPIITQEQGERLRRLLLDPARRTNRSARRYLLTGMLRCGKCQRVLNSTPKNGRRRYGCRMGPDAQGCGGVFIYAEMLERFITDIVLHRLDSPAMHQVTAGATDEGRVQELAEAIQAMTNKMDELAKAYAADEVSLQEWITARNGIEARLKVARGEFGRLTRREAALEYAGKSDELRERWDTLQFAQQVAIVKAVLDYAVILPAPVPGRRGLDKDRVEARWRV